MKIVGRHKETGGIIFERIIDTNQYAPPRMKWEVERDELIKKNCTCEPCNYCADNNPAKWKK